MSYLETVRNFVVDTFLFGDGANLQDDTSFLENGIIDSTGILELITFLEETYQISIQDNELVPDNLDTLKKVEQFLTKKINGSLASSN
ncbi:acyl carrier protein [candidate division KSB1 bacterium]|nr:acyl carrier protein [candidate division KSB1 bacterium]